MYGGGAAIANHGGFGLRGEGGRARHKQLQHSNAVAARSRGVAVGESEQTQAVLSWQMEAIGIVGVAAAKAVAEKEMVGGLGCHGYGQRAGAAVVGAMQGQGDWRGGGEAHCQRSTLLASYHRHAAWHVPMVLRSLLHMGKAIGNRLKGAGRKVAVDGIELQGLVYGQVKHLALFAVARTCNNGIKAESVQARVGGKTIGNALCTY